MCEEQYDTKQINLYKIVQKVLIIIYIILAFGFLNLGLCSISSNSKDCFYWHFSDTEISSLLLFSKPFSS